MITVGNPPGNGGVMEGGAHPAAVAVTVAVGNGLPIVVTLMRSTPELLKANILLLSGEALRKIGVEVNEGIFREGISCEWC